MNDQSFRRTAIGGAAVMYLVILGVASSPDLGKVEWGDAPSWITALVAFAALAAAWWAGGTAAELLRVERSREDRTERQDLERQASGERAEQANWVAAWNDRGNFVVLNGSKLPIWDVSLMALHPARPEADVVEEDLALLPPGGRPVVLSCQAKTCGVLQYPSKTSWRTWTPSTCWSRSGSETLRAELGDVTAGVP